MKKKMNNGGFSLVELIIVIAIMAVLVGVLAPQFLKYVERARNSTDITNAQEITNAVIAYATDPNNTPEDGTITVNTELKCSPEGGFVENALKDAGIKGSTVCKSKTAWSEYTIHVTVSSNGIVDFEYGASGGVENGTPDQKFKDAMK